MIEISGNIWDYHKKGFPIVITTNGTINSYGKAVMGRGVALEAKQLYPELPKHLAIRLKKYGNTVFWFNTYKLFTLPVKHNWWEKADFKLVVKSVKLLVEFVNAFRGQQCEGFSKIYMVRPGCSNGKRDWERDIKPLLKDVLDDRFVIVQI